MTEDAFLQACGGESCSSLNFGVTEFESLADGYDEVSVLLLRLPDSLLGGSAERIEVTVWLYADEELSTSDFEVAAYAIDAPCDWSEGMEDGQPLYPGEAGVSYLYCNADPDDSHLWTKDEGFIWDLVVPEWVSEPITIESGDISIRQDVAFTLPLNRTVAGSTPETIAIVSDVPSQGELFVSSAEAEDLAPYVTVYAQGCS